jgi:hypothetical protein
MTRGRSWPGTAVRQSTWSGFFPAGVLAAAPHPDGEAIHQHLQRVLSRPEFRPGSDLSWLPRALAGVFAWLGSLYGTAPVLFWLLLIGCVLLLGLVVFHLGWTIRRMLAVAPAEGAGARTAAERARLSQAYRQEALERAGHGEFTEAIRFLFLSLVYRFDEEGRLLFQQACTNREYLALFADRPQVDQDLRVFVDVLDANWYGQRPTERQRYEECLALYDRLLQRG